MNEKVIRKEHLMNRVRPIWIVFIVLFVLCGTSYAYEDVIVNHERGSFIIKDVTITDKFAGKIFFFNGYILNNTDKDWIKLYFDVTLYGKDDNVLEKFDTYTYYLKKGEIKKIFENVARPLLKVRDKNEILKYSVSFKGGEYDVKYILSMTKPINSEKLFMVDKNVSIKFKLNKESIGFTLSNKTKNPIRIDWNQVSYVDTGRKSHKVIHEGVKFSSKSEPQAPTIIPPTSSIDDVISPSGYISYSSSGNWYQKPILPEGEEALPYKGKTFSIFLPLEINGTIKDYFFSFRIVDIRL